MRKIGLIQTGAIGDIVIGLPIARHYEAAGYQVFWPIDSRYVHFFREAAPYVTFIPVDPAVTGVSTAAYFVEFPKAVLAACGVQDMHLLYSFLGTYPLENRHLAHSLKFDEYKYAVTGVPFDEKWNLQIVENPARQQQLIEKLNLADNYVIVHEEGGPGSNFHRSIELEQELVQTCQVVKIAPLTDSPFDWIPIFKKAQAIHVVDSLAANLIEQLRIPGDKTLYLRSEVRLTPVFANGWKFK